MSDINRILVFLELHYQTSIPDLKFEINGQSTAARSRLVSRDSQGFDKRIFEIDHRLESTNKLSIIMDDKPNLPVEKIMEQHFVVVRQIEIDKIALDQVLNHCNSQLTLDYDWWQLVRSKGLQIAGKSTNNLYIHGNGRWELLFTRPIWEWKCSWL